MQQFCFLNIKKISVLVDFSEKMCKFANAMESKMTKGRPRMAIIDSNVLALVGLKQILQQVMPIADISTFSSFEELEMEGADSFFHFFVEMSIVLSQRSFFQDRRRRTIVLTTSQNPDNHLSEFHCLCTAVSEKELVRSLLVLVQRAHGQGQNLPPMPKALHSKILSDREIEVLSLIAQGLLNKEIADKLNISMTTVITHRKNIVEKLGMRTVSALTIYAVMHGYVDINCI